MKNIKTYLLATWIVLLFLCPSIAKGQNGKPFPNGFHLGITGEGNVAEQMTAYRLSGDLPVPKCVPVMGWKSGLELSYHFADYFGVSLGLHYGTTAQVDCFKYDLNLNAYIGIRFADRICDFQMPVKFEFHLPVKSSNWSVYSTIGINLVDVIPAIYYQAKGRNPRVADDFCYEFIFTDGENAGYKQILYDENGYKLKIDAQLNLGIYYRLPYNDLLRLGIVANFAFRDKLVGYYKYRDFDNEFGAMSYRHNYIGLEAAYIHSFKTRAQRKSLQPKETETFDFSHPVHSVSVKMGNALVLGNRIAFKEGISRAMCRATYSPELSLKYNCTFAKGFGLSAAIPFGFYAPYLKVDLTNALPRDTVWSNGAIGEENLRDNEWKLGGFYTGLALRASYTKAIHRNVFIQPELGLSWKFLFSSLNSYLSAPQCWYAYMAPNSAQGEPLPVYAMMYLQYPTLNWVPNLSGALNFLVHGKNPCHNFVFGLDFNVDFSKQMVINYATDINMPEKYRSAGQFVFNMTTIGLHIGYQFMTGRKQGTGIR